ncbi:MAG: cytochrome P450 [Ketobacteraceae bacterium]|nr:cytochrome P450 [Ketobacteraceae bacterium]
METETTHSINQRQCPVGESVSVDAVPHVVQPEEGGGKRPPLIRSTPIIGPLRQFTGNVLPFLAKTRKAYGDAFRMRILGMDMTCLCGQDAVALLGNDDLLCTARSMKVLQKAVNSRLPMTFDGPLHKVYRKAHSNFLNRKLERARRGDIIDCLKQQTSRWQPGHSFDALTEAQSQTVQVLSQLLNGEPFPFSRADLSRVIHTLIYATYGHIPLWMALANPAYRRAQKRMNEHFLALVARVRASPELTAETMVGQYLGCPPPEGTDHWEDDDLKIVPLMAYLAGYDTVASAAGFLLYRLLSHPGYLQKVRDEYRHLARENDGNIDPMDQKLLRAAFQETVRINPPGALVIRYAKQDFRFGGYRIRKGDEVLVQISGDHLNEAMFPEPEKFDPTRFIGRGASERKRHVLAFGSGAHRCTGAMIGPLITQEMVSYWINHFELELVPGKAQPRIVARPFTQPVGLTVRVVGTRSPV